jgi:membrane-associated phospholipid phosphatase
MALHRRWWPLVLAGAVVGTAAALGAWVAGAGVVPGERALLIGLHAATGGPVERAAVVISDLSNLMPLTVVAAGVLAVLLIVRRRQDVALFVPAVAVVWAVNPLLKDLVGRPRPGLWPLPESVSEYAFPSGHAADSAALVAGLLLVVRGRRRRIAAAVVGAAWLALVGLSQLVLGRHYPTDLLGGWLWAGAWVILVATAAPRGSGDGDVGRTPGR